MRTTILLQRLCVSCLIIIGAAIFTSCGREDSASVDQDTIWTYYELFYNANEDKTYARTTFRFSNGVGTLLELSDGAEVSFNGDPLTFRPLLAFYEKEYAGLTTNGTFEYTDLDENTFTNSTTEMNSVAFPEDVTAIPQDASFELFWLGEPIQEGEAVVIFAEGVQENDGQLFTQDDVGATSVILDKDKLESMSSGANNFYMERYHTNNNTDATTSGGSLVLKYRSENAEITLE